jgi:hypothetical protein
MNKKQFQYGFLIALGVIAMSAWAISSVSAKEFGLMTKDELKLELGNADLVILDVRTGKDWTSSEFKIKNATRVNPREFSSWKDRFDKDKKLVLYCA